MPLWEASYELDPPLEDWIANAAWQIARAARIQGVIYRGDFDATEPAPTEPASADHLAAVAARIAATWPNKTRDES